MIAVTAEDRFITEWRRKQTNGKDLEKFLIYANREK
jgi:hypothetical protein